MIMTGPSWEFVIQNLAEGGMSIALTGQQSIRNFAIPPPLDLVDFERHPKYGNINSNSIPKPQRFRPC